MRLKPWAQLPTKWVHTGVLSEYFKWGSSASASGAGSIAALQLLVTLATQAELVSEVGLQYRVATPTYDELMRAAGLSRKLISSGLTHLSDTGLLEIERVGHRNSYYLTGYEEHWCKLPARALYNGDKIFGFHAFHKRAVCELHAMKLFIYYAVIRDRITAYSTASFETIHKRTGVIEKMIPRANSVLINAGLLSRIDKDSIEGSKRKEPNKYYLVGYKDLFV